MADFDNKEMVANELGRVLVAGGLLHIWHLSPRQRINEIHATASGVVRRDRLPPAKEAAELFSGVGFQISTVEETEGHHLVTAVKPT